MDRFGKYNYPTFHLFSYEQSLEQFLRSLEYMNTYYDITDMMIPPTYLLIAWSFSILLKVEICAFS